MSSYGTSVLLIHFQASQGETKQHCVNVQTPNCTRIPVERNVTRQVPVTSTVLDKRTECRMIPVTEPGTEREIEVPQNLYRQGLITPLRKILLLNSHMSDNMVTSSQG